MAKEKLTQKGFSLLELLAVIVILAVLAIIVTPLFVNKSGEAKQVVYNENVRILQKQAQEYLLDQATIPAAGTDIIDSMVSSGKIKEKPINPITNIKDYKVVVNTDGTASVIVSANIPKLLTGMTPVKWVGVAGSGVETPTTEADPAWYSYNGDIVSTVGGIQYTVDKWANAKLADTNGSLFVWIPRYTYKITEAATGQIQIKYSNGTTDDTLGGYKVHPAFNFGGSQLTGIWVAKFEASSNAGKVQVRPGVASWTSISVDAIFTACRVMQTTNSASYGISSDTTKMDTHMMKNSEWGAVAYLAEAIRDRNEIWINNSFTNITGSAGITVSASFLDAITNDYKSIQGMKASTTGNEYGVYDMSGGAAEYVASYTGVGNANGASLLAATAKYKDTLAGATSANGQTNYTGAEGMTDGWALHEVMDAGIGNSTFQGYGDYQEFPYSTYPFFVRGSDFFATTNAGAFAGNCNNGGGGDVHKSFRPVLVGLK